MCPHDRRCRHLASRPRAGCRPILRIPAGIWPRRSASLQFHPVEPVADSRKKNIRCFADHSLFLLAGSSVFSRVIEPALSNPRSTHLRRDRGTRLRRHRRTLRRHPRTRLRRHGSDPQHRRTRLRRHGSDPQHRRTRLRRQRSDPQHRRTRLRRHRSDPRQSSARQHRTRDLGTAAVSGTRSLLVA
jgi:hypothetical protein